MINSQTAKVIDLKFLTLFPDGFEDEEWNNLGKKHDPSKIFRVFENELSKKELKRLLKEKDYEEICEVTSKLIKKATIVSVFEKVAFSNFIAKETTEDFCVALYNFLYNYNEDTFEEFVSILAKHKHSKNANAAKWPIVSFLKAYQDPNNFIILKPNTVKAVAKALEFDIGYQTKPNYQTYNNVIEMVRQYQDNSSVCKDKNLMLTQAVLFVVTI